VTRIGKNEWVLADAGDDAVEAESPRSRTAEPSTGWVWSAWSAMASALAGAPPIRRG